MESFTVSSTLTVKDELTVALERIAELAIGTGKAVASVQSSMAGWARFAQTIDRLAPAFNRATAAVDKFNAAQASALNNASSRLDMVLRQADRAADVAAAAVAGRSRRQIVQSVPLAAPVGEPYGEPSRPTPYWRPQIPYMGAPLAEPVGRPSFGMPAVPPPVYGPPTINGAGREIAPYRWNFSGGGPGGGSGQVPAPGIPGGGYGAGATVAGGYVLRQAGEETLGFLGKTYEAAKGYEQALARFKTLDLGDAINQDADRFAQGSGVMGASATDLITTLTDLHTVMGDYANAKAVTPLIARMEFANKAVFDANSKFDEGQALALAKVIELRGGFRSQDEMMTQADFMQHVLSGTGGRVTPKDYLAFMKTGGVAARLQSNEVFYYEMEPLIQEIGGMRAGTGLMSAYQNLGQGRTTLRAARELERLGLVDPKLAEYDKLGHLLQIKPGGVRGGDLAGSDPMKMLTDVLLPAFKAHGIDITDNKAVINELSTVITNRTASALYATLFQQMDKIAKNMAVDAKAMGIKGLEEKAEGTPAAAEIKASNAWKDLRIQMGLDIIPIIIPMLNGLAGGLKALATAAHDHPIITSGLLLVAGAIGALAAVGGTVVLAVAGLKALAFVFTLPGFAGASLTGLAGNLGLVARGMLGMLGPIAAVVAALAYFKPPDDVVEKRLKDAQKNPLGVGKPGEGWLDNLFGFEAEPDDESAGLNTNRWAPPEPRVYGKVTAPLPPLSSSSAQPSPAADPGLVDRIAAAIKAALHGTAVMMDGQTVGRLVTDHQAREGDRPPSSSSLFDMRMAPLYPNQ